MPKFRTGNGADWLDLLATLGGRYRATQVDALAGPAEWLAWLRLHGLEPMSAVTEADVAAVRAVREALHRVTAAALRDAAPEAADVRLIGQTLAADKPVQVRRGAAGLAITRPADAAEALARLTRDAVQDLAGPRRAQLHACGDDTCSGIFVDATGRRRWCSDQTCGNRARVRAFRSRSREA